MSPKRKRQVFRFEFPVLRGIRLSEHRALCFYRPTVSITSLTGGSLKI